MSFLPCFVRKWIPLYDDVGCGQQSILGRFEMFVGDKVDDMLENHFEGRIVDSFTAVGSKFDPFKEYNRVEKLLSFSVLGILGVCMAFLLFSTCFRILSLHKLRSLRYYIIHYALIALSLLYLCVCVIEFDVVGATIGPFVVYHLCLVIAGEVAKKLLSRKGVKTCRLALIIISILLMTSMNLSNIQIVPSMVSIFVQFISSQVLMDEPEDPAGPSKTRILEKISYMLFFPAQHVVFIPPKVFRTFITSMFLYPGSQIKRVFRKYISNGLFIRELLTGPGISIGFFMVYVYFYDWFVSSAKVMNANGKNTSFTAFLWHVSMYSAEFRLHMYYRMVRSSLLLHLLLGIPYKHLRFSNEMGIEIFVKTGVESMVWWNLPFGGFLREAVYVPVSKTIGSRLVARVVVIFFSISAHSFHPYVFVHWAWWLFIGELDRQLYKKGIQIPKKIRNFRDFMWMMYFCVHVPFVRFNIYQNVTIFAKYQYFGRNPRLPKIPHLKEYLQKMQYFPHVLTILMIFSLKMLPWKREDTKRKRKRKEKVKQNMQET